MKKHLITLCVLAGSAAAAPYYLPSPPGGGLMPEDWQPVANLEGLYAIGASDTPDTCGFRLGMSLYDNADSDIRHEFTLGMAPQWGNEHRQELFHMPLTGGYTLNLNLWENLFLFMGADAGWFFGHYKNKHPLHHESGSCNGFTFSVGAGLKVQCSERLYAQAGYDFARSYTNTRHDDIWTQHIIYAGIGCRF